MRGGQRKREVVALTPRTYYVSPQGACKMGQTSRAWPSKTRAELEDWGVSSSCERKKEYSEVEGIRRMKMLSGGIQSYVYVLYCLDLSCRQATMTGVVAPFKRPNAGLRCRSA